MAQSDANISILIAHRIIINWKMPQQYLQPMINVLETGKLPSKSDLCNASEWLHLMNRSSAMNRIQATKIPAVNRKMQVSGIVTIKILYFVFILNVILLYWNRNRNGRVCVCVWVKSFCGRIKCYTRHLIIFRLIGCNKGINDIINEIVREQVLCRFRCSSL